MIDGDHPSHPTPPKRVRLGLSTCPNDTYLIHGLMSGAVKTPGLTFEIELLDVQALNERLLEGSFDIAKASYHLALRMAGQVVALPTGSALGFGNGPLLLGREGVGQSAPGPTSRVLCPGEHTTATLLYRMFHPQGAEPKQVVFSEIMPALKRGDADFGVCIHEGRFTYDESGLELIEDMGGTWETATSSPLPLGGLFARSELDEVTIDRALAALLESLSYADEHPDEALETMRAHAQELDDDVIWSHVNLYVNGWTRDLGPQGKLALDRLRDRAAAVGAIKGDRPLEVFVPLHKRRLFHAVPSRSIPHSNATSVRLTGPLTPPSLASEGFIHLSFLEQLQGSLDVHLKGEDTVVVLEVDPDHAGSDVRMEPSRGGATFPHLYRHIELETDVIAHWEISRDARGCLSLPAGIHVVRDPEDGALGSV